MTGRVCFSGGKQTLLVEVCLFQRPLGSGEAVCWSFGGEGRRAVLFFLQKTNSGECFGGRNQTPTRRVCFGGENQTLAGKVWGENKLILRLWLRQACFGGQTKTVPGRVCFGGQLQTRELELRSFQENSHECVLGWQKAKKTKSSSDKQEGEATPVRFTRVESQQK